MEDVSGGTLFRVSSWLRFLEKGLCPVEAGGGRCCSGKPTTKLTAFLQEAPGSCAKAFKINALLYSTCWTRNISLMLDTNG